VQLALPLTITAAPADTSVFTEASPTKPNAASVDASRGKGRLLYMDVSVCGALVTTVLSTNPVSHSELHTK